MPALHSLAPELRRLAGAALDASNAVVAVFLRDAEELSYVAGNLAHDLWEMGVDLIGVRASEPDQEA